MIADEHPLVGNDCARAVLGRSAGGDLVVLPAARVGEAGRGIAEVLRPFGLTDRSAPSDRSGPGALEPLRHAATVAALRGDVPLVLVAGDLELSPVALLDVLDAAADRTTVAVVDASSEPAPVGPALVRVARGTRLVTSAGSAHHVVTDPTGYAVGVLRIRGGDRGLAARVLTRAAGDTADWAAVAEPVDLALVALVRAGVPVSAAPYGPYAVRRGGLERRGLPGSAWQQRLRAASRGNDGAFSTAVVRPVSRRLTAVGLGRGWSPNGVTLVSLLLGLAACALTATGARWAWSLAAVLLMASLVVDCVDGEIARFTRRSSALGGWLDAVSDRVKEFAMVGAVAWVAAREGADLWWLAVAVLTVLAVRHVEDFAQVSRSSAQVGSPVADRVPFDQPRDLGPATARTSLLPPPTTRARAVHIVKQVIHLPIAERYLVMTVALLAFSPAFFLWSLGCLSLFALTWTQAGRLARALRGRDGFRGRPDPALARLVDLTVLPRPTGRSRFAWQLPAALLGLEAAVLLWVSAGAGPSAGAAAYGWLVAVSWHVYDTVYRVRETGRGPAVWLRRVVGLEVRLVVLVLTALLVADPTLVLIVGALVLLTLYAAESRSGWAAHLRASRGPAPVPDGQDGAS